MDKRFMTGAICTTLAALFLIFGVYFYALQSNKLYAQLREECIKNGGSVVESFNGVSFHCIRGIR